MRLGQIARKVNAKPAEIRSFLKDQFDVDLDKDPNVKIESEHEAAILENFKKEEIVEEVVEPVQEEVVEELEIDPSIDTDLESLMEVVEETVQEEAIEIPEVQAEEAIEPTENTEEEIVVSDISSDAEIVEIDYDSEEEATEETGSFEEVPVDPDAAIIAAKVEKLEGLKVVGKIELEDEKITKKLMNEEVELPSSDAIESEIDALDGDVDTSEFEAVDISDNDKDAIFAELDAQMDNRSKKGVKAGTVKPATEVSEHQDDEEYSIYKDAKGIYHFSSEQKKNRKESLRIKAEKERIQRAKEKKARYYQKQVAAKVQKPAKKKAPSKKVAQKKAAQEAKQQAPKGLWGKFLNWINDRD